MPSLFALARRGVELRPDDVKEAVRLYCQWTGHTPTNGIHFAAAVAIANGNTPNGFAARRMSVDIDKAFARSPNVLLLDPFPGFLLGL